MNGEEIPHSPMDTKFSERVEKVFNSFLNMLTIFDPRIACPYIEISSEGNNLYRVSILVKLNVPKKGDFDEQRSEITDLSLGSDPGY